ncbi:hypothetical protein A2U01_0026316, partial [Trifolium medium]|nr:hypothetical protein [Trifolium medium]
MSYIKRRSRTRSRRMLRGMKLFLSRRRGSEAKSADVVAENLILNPHDSQRFKIF